MQGSGKSGRTFLLGRVSTCRVMASRLCPQDSLQSDHGLLHCLTLGAWLPRGVSRWAPVLKPVLLTIALAIPKGVCHPRRAQGPQEGHDPLGRVRGQALLL